MSVGWHQSASAPERVGAAVAVLALLLSVAGIIGDLIESLLKREICVVVGLPATLSRRAAPVPWATLIMAVNTKGNVIAFNVRDRESDAARVVPHRALQLARVCAGLGIALEPRPHRPPAGSSQSPFITLLALIAY